jgi:sRNA-binding regulator protein Hfq
VGTAIEHLRLFMHIRKFIANKNRIVLLLLNGDKLQGTILSYDDCGIVFEEEDGKLVLIPYGSIVAIEYSQN